MKSTKILKSCNRCDKKKYIYPSRLKQSKKFYCSYDCFQKTRAEKILKIKCKWCGKEVRTCKARVKQFCSRHCLMLSNIENKKGMYSRKSSLKGAKTSREKKIGIFNSKSRKKQQESCKKNGTGFFDKKLLSDLGKRAAESHRKNKTGVCHDPKLKKKVTEYLMKNKKAIFSEKSHKKSLKTISENKNLFVEGLHFMSGPEAEIGLCLNFQIEKLKEGYNFQVNVGGKFIDFILHSIKLAIEYHDIMSFQKETKESYYKKRRKILNQNGYKDYDLIILNQEIFNTK